MPAFSSNLADLIPPVPLFAKKGKQSVKLDEAMARHVEESVKICEGKVEDQGGAAQRLGVSPGALRNGMRKLGIPFGQKR